MSQSSLPCFDQLLELAREAPDQLENLRLKMTREILDGVPDRQMRQRLQQLSFRIDAERRRGRPPLALCMHYSELMHRHLEKLHQHLDFFLEPLPETDLPTTASISRPSGKILQLADYRKGA
ncbi:DUF3135 domain-containing protein [Marinospirillum perlucidum]|uniref:DUF3135 domain-containing protein n=1 Tax=Marinospirillum perlucidum TaxID=1982602 RepID=UPI000DF2A662|nr:DUF3135 domain-containing protein [Marinospirillum perlucidum]